MANKKPIHTIRRGAVEAAIWENDSSKGRFFRATFTRSYRDKNGKAASSASFGERELPVLALLIGQSEAWMHEAAHEAEEAADESAEEGGDDAY